LRSSKHITSDACPREGRTWPQIAPPGVVC
jgi:hypothetical protein